MILAATLFALEDRFKKKHAEASLARRAGADRYPDPPKIYLPAIDPARILAVFMSRGEINIVWDDEYVPIPFIDEEYRRLRCAKYGRTADVETVVVKNNVTYYDYVFGEPQPYELSLHFSARRPYRRRLFSWTWNHMLSDNPSPWVMIRGGYRRAQGYELRYGTREDAEDYAREHGC